MHQVISSYGDILSKFLFAVDVSHFFASVFFASQIWFGFNWYETKIALLCQIPSYQITKLQKAIPISVDLGCFAWPPAGVQLSLNNLYDIPFPLIVLELNWWDL